MVFRVVSLLFFFNICNSGILTKNVLCLVALNSAINRL